MAFFNHKQKKLAMRKSKENLLKGYSSSEENLRRVAKTGNLKELRKAMKEHGNYEYALLYRQTPEFHCKKYRKH